MLGVGDKEEEEEEKGGIAKFFSFGKDKDDDDDDDKKSGLSRFLSFGGDDDDDDEKKRKEKDDGGMLDFLSLGGDDDKEKKGGFSGLFAGQEGGGAASGRGASGGGASGGGELSLMDSLGEVADEMAAKDQDVTVSFQDVSFIGGGVREAHNGGEVEEYLDDEGFVLEPGAHAQLAHVGRLVDEVLDAVEDAAAGGGDAAVDTALADGLPGHTGVGVDILQTGLAEPEQNQTPPSTLLRPHPEPEATQQPGAGEQTHVVSAIHDISRSPVLMSGAGTSMPGPGQWTGSAPVAVLVPTGMCVCVVQPHPATDRRPKPRAEPAGWSGGETC
ncbi:hypothetical protein N1851_026761 [Merluccius polli]|uniref:Uncharacterized protein n=1 Tax=Merluccius polli TaxID=89951 RepID=A0AA47MBI6_MERPO|nr:hypothetical protein N1851_026761 [Merluccius polli]